MLSEREAKIRDAVRCPKCAAEPGEPCFSSEGYYHVGTHWPERFDLYQATLRGELYASTRCHVCGVDTPHAHWNDEIGTVDVRMPAIILRRLLTNGEVSPTGLLLARLLHFLRRAKPTDAGTGAGTSGEAANAGAPRGPRVAPSVAIRILRGGGADTAAVNELEAAIDYLDYVNAEQTAKLVAQADAIKAAVAEALDRAADGYVALMADEPPFIDMTPSKFEAWLRSGAHAPGEGGK